MRDATLVGPSLQEYYAAKTIAIICYSDYDHSNVECVPVCVSGCALASVLREWADDLRLWLSVSGRELGGHRLWLAEPDPGHRALGALRPLSRAVGRPWPLAR